jgi:hypothetical protein
MAFNKFDPHAEEDADEGLSPQALRRARLLKYGWWITMVYTAMGFLFLGVFYFWGNPF